MDTNQNQENILKDINTVVFDIVGTLLDSTGTINRETQDVLSNYEIDEKTSQNIAGEWIAGQNSFQQAIINGKQPWVVEDDIRRYQLALCIENWAF